MSPIPNPRVIYAKLPVGYPVAGENLVYEADAETIDLDLVVLNGGILTKTLYISIDPYLRGRMRDPAIKSYNEPMTIGQIGESGAIVKVLRSENPRFKVGDHLDAVVHWCAYNVLPKDAQASAVENSYNLPWSAFLGVAGIPGATAFYATHLYANFKEGETIFVSTAAGAVGSIVVQLAKLHGLKVIGSTGDDEKLEHMKKIGVDVAFNYKKENVWEVLEKHGPINVYFDNVGGEQLDAALINAAKGARFLMCGHSSEYNRLPGKEPYGVKNMNYVLRKSITLYGFIIFDLIPQYGRQLFVDNYLPLVKEGTIQHREDRSYGLENLADGLIRVLKGENKGKGIVVVAED